MHVSNNTPCFFFHRSDFIFRNPGSKIISFPVTEKETNVKMYFTLHNKNLVSLGKSPFGGFVFLDEHWSIEAIELIKSVIVWATDNEVEKILIRNFPEIYSLERSFLINDILGQAGFTQLCKDVNQVIKVEPHSNMLLNTHRRRRLRKCIDNGFTFKKLAAASLEVAYELFIQSRTNKGYAISMTLCELQDVFAKFPQNYLLFGVFDGDKMIAASVSIRVNDTILYCFYVGDHLSYRLFSPVTFLINEIYAYCVHHNIRLLDLGTSGEKGIVSRGVYNFKKSLGSIDSYKLTFCRTIE